MGDKVSKKENQLRQLQDLLNSDAITKEEFEVRKKEILFNENNKKEKKNILLIISSILTIIYLVLSLTSVVKIGMNISSDMETAAMGIATILVFPHYFLTFLALIFNVLGIFTRKKGFVLTGAILYTVAMVSFPIYFFFVVTQMILSYIGYAQMKKE